MWVDNDSRPSIAPIAGGSAGGRDLRLTAADGTRSMADAARAARPPGAGRVVIPDVRHSVFDRRLTEFADAWKRVQAFVSQHTKR